MNVDKINQENALGHARADADSQRQFIDERILGARPQGALITALANAHKREERLRISNAYLLAALEDSAFDAHVASCRQGKRGTNLEFAKCTYGPCERWKAVIKEAKSSPSTGSVT